jgi:acid phosphatase family membrane protein YuiD
MKDFLSSLLNPYVVGLSIAWFFAQVLKVPFHYLSTKEWKWNMAYESGGFPSSHSCIVTETACLIGLREGFDSAFFALSIALAAIVIYDATHVRREAGIHAQRLNIIFTEMFADHQFHEEALREVIGHTPWQVAGGFVLGAGVAIIIHFIWI